MAVPSSTALIIAPENYAERPPKEVAFVTSSREDESYLKTYFQKVEGAILKNDDNPLQIIADLHGHVSSAIEDIKDGKATSKFANHLFRVSLVRIVNALIDRSYPVPEWLKAVLEWFHYVLQAAIRCIINGFHPEDLLRAVEKLFTRSFLLYKSHGHDEDVAPLRARFYPSSEAAAEGSTVASEELYAEIQPTDATNSYYLIDMISKFGSLGGFDAILRRLAIASPEIPKVSCTELKQLLELLEHFRLEIRREFLLSYVPVLHTAVRSHIESFSDAELRNQSIEDLVDCLIVVSKLASRSPALAHICEEIEKFKLLLSLRCVQLPFLEARLKGIEQIKHLIKVASGQAHHHTRARPKRQKPAGYRPGGWVTAVQKGTAIQGPLTATAAAIAAQRGGGIPPAPPMPLTMDPLEQAIQASLETARLEAAAKDPSASASAPLPQESATEDVPCGPQLPDSASPTPAATTVAEEAPKPTPDSAAPSAANSNSGDATASSTLTGTSGTSDSAEETSNLVPLISTETMYEWLIENDIIQLVLSFEHSEALKQGKDLILFVAKQKPLQKPVLEAIWKASDKHESIQAEVFGIISSLLEHLASDQIEFFYEHILQLPSSSFDAQVLTFIGNFTREAIKARKARGEEPKLYGLEIFWSLLMKTAHETINDARQTIIDETSKHVEDLLREYPDQRETFMKRCIDNLANGDMVSVSLKLITNIMLSYETSQINQAIQDLESKYQLIESVLSDLSRTTVPSRAHLSASSTGKQGLFPAVQARLSFISFILTESELRITREQALQLWDALMCIENQADLDAIYDWIEQASFGYLAPQNPYLKKKTKVFRAFTPEVTEALFLERMLSMDFSRFTLPALKLYRRFFLAVNAHQKRLRRLEENEVFIRSFDLVGMEQLWTIGMESADTAVAINALAILRQLYANVSQKLASQIHQKRVDFVLKCTEHLQRAATTISTDPDNTSSIQRIERCLYLLTTVVSNDNLSRHSSQIHGQATKIMEPKPFVYREPASIKTQAASLSGDGSASSSAEKPSSANEEESAEQKAAKEAALQAKLAEIEQLRQTARAEQHAEYLQHIENLAIKRQQEAEHAKAQREAEAAAGIVRPSDILTRGYLDLLFGLLPINNVRRSVWNLIQLLPTDPNLKVALQELTQSGADGHQLTIHSYLDQSSPALFVYRLVYLLQLTRVAAKDQEWCRRFSELGGTAFLSKLFSEHSFADASAADFGKMAIAYLVETLDALIGASQSSTAINADFVTRLMSQILDVAARPKTDQSVSQDAFDAKAIEDSMGQKSSGTRFANCWYGTAANTLIFEFEPQDQPVHFQAAVYAVDYNTIRREIRVAPHLRGEMEAPYPTPSTLTKTIPENGFTLVGNEFHQGQWMVWDVHGKGPLAFDICHMDGPNWVFVCLLIDPPKNPNTPISHEPLPIAIDSKTQGRWRGKYGRWGGVFLGEEDIVVPLRPDHPEHAPRLTKWTATGCQKYEWEKTLVNDERALQLVPNKEAMDHFSSDEESADVSSLAAVASTSSDLVVAEEVEVQVQTSTALLEMLLKALSQDKSLIPAMLNYPQLPEWIFNTLVSCQDEKVRRGVADCIAALQANAELGFFLQILLGFLGRIGSIEGSFTEYFSLLDILMSSADSAGAAVTYDKQALFEELVNQLKTHPVVETDDDADDKPDTGLHGLLKLLCTVLKDEPQLQATAVSRHGLAEFLYHDCLFGAPVDRHALNIPKAKSRICRAEAFNLLVILLSSTPSSRKELADRLGELLAKAPTATAWSIEIDSDTSVNKESKSKYAGLVNQGCTCYLNSTVQQLYIIPTLRRALLNVPLKAPEETTALPAEENSNLIGSDPRYKSNIMYQVQTLFAFLQETRNSYVDPLNFCRTVRIAGAPIEMHRQEDANEFFNTLADQLEPHLLGSPQATIFRDVFGGNNTGQIISMDCEHRSERPESYLTISVTVQNKRNLKEALETFVHADILDGDSKYMCEQCSPPQYVRAKKRECIEHLPNTLIIHLKRFEFDFETFENVKVNSRFEFPYLEELDMFPYTKEGLAEAEGHKVPQNEIRPDDYYRYRLVGILIHNGTANSGHYYSYIKERAYQGSGIDFASWYEFNDRNVRQFDPLSIPEHCFGGKYEGSEKYSSYGESMKSYSAYMLFYERANHYEPSHYGPPLGPLGVVSGSGQSEREVEPAILDRIWSDSLRTAQKRQILSRPTFDFIWNLISSTPADSFEPVLEYRDLTDQEITESPLVQSIQLGTRFLMGVLSHCTDKHAIAKKFEFLTSLYMRHLPSCKWLLETVSQARTCSWLRDVLLVCPDHDIRVGCIDMLSTILKVCSPHEYPIFSEKRYVPLAAGSEPQTLLSAQRVEATSPVTRTIDVLISILTGAADKPPARIQDLLFVLYRFALQGVHEKQALLERNAVLDLLALYDAQRASMSTMAGANKLGNLIDLLAELVVSCDNPYHLQATDAQAAIPPQTGLELPRVARDKLFNKAFLTHALKQYTYVPSLIRIFQHWCFGDLDATEAVYTVVCQAVDTIYQPKERQAYLDTLEALLVIPDDHLEWRVSQIMSSLSSLVLKNMRLETFRVLFLEFIFYLASRYREVQRWVEANEDFYVLMHSNKQIIAQWMQIHCPAYINFFDLQLPPPPPIEELPSEVSIESKPGSGYDDPNSLD